MCGILHSHHRWFIRFSSDHAEEKQEVFNHGNFTQYNKGNNDPMPGMPELHEGQASRKRLLLRQMPRMQGIRVQQKTLWSGAAYQDRESSTMK